MYVVDITAHQYTYIASGRRSDGGNIKLRYVPEVCSFHFRHINARHCVSCMTTANYSISVVRFSFTKLNMAGLFSVFFVACFHIHSVNRIAIPSEIVSGHTTTYRYAYHAFMHQILQVQPNKQQRTEKKNINTHTHSRRMISSESRIGN